jgi:hypothetical protein
MPLGGLIPRATDDATDLVVRDTTFPRSRAIARLRHHPSPKGPLMVDIAEVTADPSPDRLTPDNCAVLCGDHQPQMSSGTGSGDRTIIDATVGLARAARVVDDRRTVGRALPFVVGSVATHRVSASARSLA